MATATSDRRAQPRNPRSRRNMSLNDNRAPRSQGSLTNLGAYRSREQFHRDIQIMRGSARPHPVASAAAKRSLQSVNVSDLKEDEKGKFDALSLPLALRSRFGANVGFL